MNAARTESVLDHEVAMIDPFSPNSKPKTQNFKDLMVEIYKYRLRLQVVLVVSDRDGQNGLN